MNDVRMMVKLAALRGMIQEFYGDKNPTIYTKDEYAWYDIRMSR